MKKLLFVMALIGVLIGSTLGGIALAAKPAGVDPIETLEQNTETIIEGVGNITDRLDDEVFGLEEIKSEVSNIEDEVLHPDWGLKEIKSEVASIEGNITDSEFGLAEIKTEVDAIEGNITDTAFGLVAIKAEVEAIEAKLDNGDYGLAQIKAEVVAIESKVEEILDMMPCTPGVLQVDIVDITRNPSTDRWRVVGYVRNRGDYQVENIDIVLFIDGNKLGLTLHRDALGSGHESLLMFNFSYETDGAHSVVVRAGGAALWGECLTAYDTESVSDL